VADAQRAIVEAVGQREGRTDGERPLDRSIWFVDCANEVGLCLRRVKRGQVPCHSFIPGSDELLVRPWRLSALAYGLVA